MIVSLDCVDNTIDILVCVLNLIIHHLGNGK